jgi:hypothetical protein
MDFVPMPLPVHRPRQWKIALSLAIVGGLATPFVFGTYKVRPPSLQTWLPLTEEGKANVIAFMKRTNNCEDFVGRGDDYALESCRYEQKALKEGGVYGPRPSLLLYLAINAAAAILAFGAIFGLTFLLPALLRRYWKWLNA